MNRRNIPSELPEARDSYAGNTHAANGPEADAMADCRSIAEALRRSGVSAEVRQDARDPGWYVVANVPRGRLPTVERVMAELGLPWRRPK